jgi:hypothetical protein
MNKLLQSHFNSSQVDELSVITFYRELRTLNWSVGPFVFKICTNVTENTVSIVVDMGVCLPLYCRATNFLYLRALSRYRSHRKHTHTLSLSLSLYIYIYIYIRISMFEACLFLHSCSLATSYDIRPVFAHSVAGCLSSRCLAVLWANPLHY